MRSNWVKRVLFLADRVALVNQAVNAFKRHLPDGSPVNLVTEKDAEGRVFVSTYPTMMGLIDETKDGQRRFGVGHFDMVIIDETHRSVFQKYRAIFDYFDSLLVGLTASGGSKSSKGCRFRKSNRWFRGGTVLPRFRGLRENREQDRGETNAQSALRIILISWFPDTVERLAVI